MGPREAGVGVNPNEGMLAVARRQAPEMEWHQGRAEALPFEGDHFDIVASQFGLVFFTDQQLAIQEVMRILRPGGRLAAAVWDSVENFPIYAEPRQILINLIGNANKFTEEGEVQLVMEEVGDEVHFRVRDT